jgi:CheY-like chemotaxis protein
MTPPLPIEQLERLRSGSRRLAEQAAVNEHDLCQLLKTVQFDLRALEAARAAATRTTDAAIGLADALRLQVARQLGNIAEAQRLCLQARQHQLATDRLVKELHGPDHTGRERRARIVLVVDDYRDGREFLSLALHQAGFTVRTAENGLEAVLAAYELHPAVIIMDVKMPVLDGIQATRLIKAINELRDACVIAYSGQPIPEQDAAAAEALFSAVLSKPCSPEAVVQTVQRYAAWSAA